MIAILRIESGILLLVPGIGVAAEQDPYPGDLALLLTGLSCGLCLALLAGAVSQLTRLHRETREPTVGLNRELPQWRFLGVTILISILCGLLLAGNFVLLPQGLLGTLAGADAAAWWLALMPLPVLLGEALAPLHWPQLGITRLYHQNLVERRRPLNRLIRRGARLLSVGDEARERSPSGRVLSILADWLDAYIIGALMLGQVRANLAQLRVAGTRAQVAYQLLLDSALWLTLVSMLILGLVLLAGPSAWLAATWGLVPVVFTMVVVAQVVALVIATIRFDLTDGTPAAYVPKELAAVMPRHRGSTPASRAAQRSSETRSLQRRIGLDVLVVVVVLALLVLAVALAAREAPLGGWAAAPEAAWLIPGVCLLLVAWVSMRLQVEINVLWETVGIAVGARLPVHFVRQAAHRINNLLESPAHALAQLDRRTEALGPDDALHLLPSEAAYLAQRCAGGRRAIRAMREWVDDLRQQGRNVRGTQDRWLSPSLDCWHDLERVAVDLLETVASLRGRERLADGTEADVEWRVRIGAAEPEVWVLEDALLAPSRVGLQSLRGLALRCDRISFHDMLANLIRNALHAVQDRPNGSGRIEIEIEYAPGSVSPVLIHVYDNGSGVPVGLRSAIFEPYISTKGSGGSGLGLYMAREFMRVLGGRITFTTSARSGSSFTEFVVSLPYQRVKQRASTGSDDRTLPSDICNGDRVEDSGYPSARDR